MPQSRSSPRSGYTTKIATEPDVRTRNFQLLDPQYDSGYTPLTMARRVREAEVAYGPVTAGARLRPKNQLTIPEEIAAAAGVASGDRFVVEFERRDPDTIRLRRVRDSYAGAFGDLYGDIEGYLESERASWDEA